MPTYEYQCLSCGHRVEVVQRFSDEPLRTCEVCGGPLRRVFHPVGIVLKGSGFYSTDNRSSKRHLEPKKDTTSSESTTSETKSDKSESKPAPKKETSSSSGESAPKQAKKKDKE